MPGGSVGEEFAYSIRDRVQSLGQEDPLEKGIANPVFLLANPTDRGAWQATVHGVARGWTQLSN